MDKFNRRPSSKETRRKLSLGLFIFVAVSLWFVALFAFGNKGALWLLAIYGAFVVFAGWLRFREEVGRYRLDWSNLPLQLMVQGPGFTPLEVEAIRVLSEASAASTDLVKRHFQHAEVQLRLNTGTGCLTKLKPALSQPLDQSVMAVIPWFRVDGLTSPVGCRFWQSDGVVDLLEFFCAGERTVDFDWAGATFSSLNDGPDRAVPKFRPALNVDLLTKRMQAAIEHVQSA